MKKMPYFLLIVVLITQTISAQNSTLDSLLNLLKTMDDGEKKVGLLNHLAYQYHTVNPTLGISYANQALEISRKIHFKTGIANSYVNIGNCNLIMSNYPTALEFYQKGLRIYEETNIYSGAAITLSNIAIIHLHLENNDKSLETFRKALEVNKKINDKYAQALILSNIGILNAKFQKYDQAIADFKNSKAMCEELKDSSGIRRNLLNIGETFLIMKDYHEALKYFYDALQLVNATGDIRERAIVLVNIGTVYTRQKEYQKAIDCYTKSLIYSKRIDYKEAIIDAYMNLSSTYYLMGNFKKAYDFQRLYIEVKDSVYNVENSKKIANLTAGFEFEKKENENKLLRKNNQIQKLDIARKNTAIYFSISSAALLLILGFVLLGRYKSKQKINNILTRKNEEITNQKNELSEAYGLLQTKSKELENQYRFLESLMDSIPNPIFFKDNDLNYIGCNREFEKFSGRSKSELIGRHAREFVSQDLAVYTDKKDLEALRNSGIQKYEARVADGTGRDMDVIYYKSRYYDIEGRVSGLIGVMLDITDRKLAEITLKKSEEQLRESNLTKDRYLEILNAELFKAEKYLMSLLPPELDNGKIKTRWRFIPSTQLGGDSFDYHWVDDENFIVYLLDVSGHGIGAALHSVAILNSLKFETLKDTDFTDPENVLASLNKAFQIFEHNGLFFTIWYGVFNTKSKSLKYASAGHHAALLIDDKGAANRLSTPNCIIGMLPDFRFTCDEVPVNSNSRLYVFSDGAFEIMKKDGSMWDIDYLFEYLEKYKQNGSAIDEIDGLYNYSLDISADHKFSDDYSMLKVCFL